MLPRLDRDAFGRLLSKPLPTHWHWIRARPACRVHYAYLPGTRPKRCRSGGWCWARGRRREGMLSISRVLARWRDGLVLQDDGEVSISAPKRAAGPQSSEAVGRDVGVQSGRWWSTSNWAKLKPGRVPDEDGKVQSSYEDAINLPPSCAFLPLTLCSSTRRQRSQERHAVFASRENHVPWLATLPPGTYHPRL
uniref:Uncharacterized protein n=1 Tax=Mycena chlorophos TaxID=658473 RepID=A0ABQ0LHD4_MYCCL|nr:predicted protein [Mycena chlorophos]